MPLDGLGHPVSDPVKGRRDARGKARQGAFLSNDSRVDLRAKRGDPRSKSCSMRMSVHERQWVAFTSERATGMSAAGRSLTYGETGPAAWSVSSWGALPEQMLRVC